MMIIQNFKYEFWVLIVKWPAVNSVEEVGVAKLRIIHY